MVEKTIDVNLRGVLRGCKAVVPQMEKQGGGKIINMASTAGLSGIHLVAANYAASKGGVIQLTKVCARELGPYGINVNAICPNLLPTGLSRGDEVEDVVKKQGISYTEAANIAFADVIKNVPMQRLGTVQEIADAILFLVSDEASYITGQALNVNGGMMMD